MKSEDGIWLIMSCKNNKSKPKKRPDQDLHICFLCVTLYLASHYFFFLYLYPQHIDDNKEYVHSICLKIIEKQIYIIVDINFKSNIIKIFELLFRFATGQNIIVLF